MWKKMKSAKKFVKISFSNYRFCFFSCIFQQVAGLIQKELKFRHFSIIFS